jgi:hypothetical protein
MKKLLLILLLSFLSKTSLAKVGDVYYCDVIQHHTIYHHQTVDTLEFAPPIFKFKLENDSLILFTDEKDVKGWNLDELSEYQIIYYNPEYVLFNEEKDKIEVFGAQNAFSSIVYSDGYYLEMSLGKLKEGYSQPYMTSYRTATCKTY